MTAAISRTIIRIHGRQLSSDDLFLLVAVVCLGASAGLFFRFKNVLYLEEAIALDSTPFLNIVTRLDLPSDFIEEVLWLQKLTYAFLSVTWSAIFSVKFSFLALFKMLVRRLQCITTYWRWVVGITAIVYGLSVCDVFIPCPRFNLSAGKPLTLFREDTGLTVVGSSMFPGKDTKRNCLSLFHHHRLRHIDRSYDYRHSCPSLVASPNGPKPKTCVRRLFMPQHMHDLDCDHSDIRSAHRKLNRCCLGDILAVHGSLHCCIDGLSHRIPVALCFARPWKRLPRVQAS